MNEDKEKDAQTHHRSNRVQVRQGLYHDPHEGGADLNIGVIPTGALPPDAALGTEACPAAASSKSGHPESWQDNGSPCRFSRSGPCALGGIVAFIDAEHALDPVYAGRASGSISTRCSISQPDTVGEQALEILRYARALGRYRLRHRRLCGGARSPCRNRGRDGDTTVGLQARLMSCGSCASWLSLSKSNTTCIFINQLREKIGVMFGKPGDDHRRTRSEVFLLGSHRHSPHRLYQAERRCGRQSREGEGGQEQGGSSFPPSGVRSHVRRGHLSGRLHRRYGRGNAAGPRNPAPGTPTGEERLGQGREAAKQTSRRTLICVRELGEQASGVRPTRSPSSSVRPKTSRSRRRPRAARRSNASWRPRPTYSQRSGRISPPGSRPLRGTVKRKSPFPACPAEDDAVWWQDRGASCAHVIRTFLSRGKSRRAL